MTGENSYKQIVSAINDVVANGNEWELWSLKRLAEQTLKRVAVAQQELKTISAIEKLLGGEVPNINGLSAEHAMNADTIMQECNYGRDLITVAYCKTTLCPSGKHIIPNEKKPFCTACHSPF